MGCGMSKTAVSVRETTPSPSHTTSHGVIGRQTQQDDVIEQQTPQDDATERRTQQDDVIGRRSEQDDTMGLQAQHDDVMEQKTQQARGGNITIQQTWQNDANDQQSERDNVNEQQSERDDVSEEQPEGDDVSEEQPEGDDVSEEQPEGDDVSDQQQPQQDAVTEQQPERDDVNERQSERVDDKQQKSEGEDVNEQQSERNDVRMQQSEWDDAEQQQSERDDVSEQQSERDDVSEQQSERDDVSEQQSERVDVSEQQSGRDDVSEQQSGRDDVSEQQSGRDDVSEQQSGRDDVSEQQSERDDISEQQYEQDDVSEQQSEREDVIKQQSERDDVIKQQSEREDVIKQQSERDDVNKQQSERENINEQQSERYDVNEQQSSQNEVKERQILRDDMNEQQPQQENVKEQQLQQDDVKGQQKRQIDVQKQAQQDDVTETQSDFITRQHVQGNTVTEQHKEHVREHKTQKSDVTVKREEKNVITGRQTQEENVAEHTVTRVSSFDDSGGDEGEGAGGERRFTIQQVAQHNERAGWLEWLPYRGRVYDCTGFKPHIHRYILSRRSELNAAFAAFDAFVATTEPPSWYWLSDDESDEDEDASGDDEKDEDDQVSEDWVEARRKDREEYKELWEEMTGRVVSEDGQLQHNGKTVTLRSSRWEYNTRWKRWAFPYRRRHFAGVPLAIASPEVWKGLSRHPGCYLTPVEDVLREYGLTCEEISRELAPFLLGRLTTSPNAHRDKVKADMVEVLADLQADMGDDKNSEVQDGWMGDWKFFSQWYRFGDDDDDGDDGDVDKGLDRRLLQFLRHWEARLAERDPQGPGDGDPNLRSFPLHVDRDSLMHWLREWEPFDTEVPADGAWYRLGLLEPDRQDPHQTFAATLRPDRPDLHLGQVQLTFAIEGEAAWDTLPEDVVLKEVMTPEQQQLQAARERRTDLHDLKRMRRRRERLAEYFIDEHDLAPAVVLPFLKWASLMEKSESDFQALCDRQ